MRNQFQLFKRLMRSVNDFLKGRFRVLVLVLAVFLLGYSCVLDRENSQLRDRLSTVERAIYGAAAEDQSTGGRRRRPRRELRRTVRTPSSGTGLVSRVCDTEAKLNDLEGALYDLEARLDDVEYQTEVKLDDLEGTLYDFEARLDDVEYQVHILVD